MEINFDLSSNDIAVAAITTVASALAVGAVKLGNHFGGKILANTADQSNKKSVAKRRTVGKMIGTAVGFGAAVGIAYGTNAALHLVSVNVETSDGTESTDDGSATTDTSTTEG